MKSCLSKKKLIYDIILISVVITIGAISLFIIKSTRKDGSRVIISLRNEVIKELDLSVDTDFTVKGENGFENTIRIENNTAFMKSANCPGNDCVKFYPPIKMSGEQIVCLPHGLIVTIEE